MEEKIHNDDEWKGKLRSALITAITEDEVKKQNAYSEVGFYYQCYAPASLYKYYSDKQRKFKEIKDGKMWYSAPCKFNDVFDCDISIDDKKVFDEALKLFSDKRGIRPGSRMWKDLRAQITKDLNRMRRTFDELRSGTGVACLCESDDSLLMWAHYANNHQGICVEYDLMDINKVLGFTAVPVIYSEERPCFNFLNPQSLQNDSTELLIHSLTSKSVEWQYEREWRIIRDKEACGDCWYADGNGALLEMIRPSSITIGCAARAEFEQEVTDYCSANRINLYKMEKDLMHYRLNKKTILEFGE